MSRRESVSIYCPGPDLKGSECVDGVLWIAEDDPDGEIPDRECPTCVGTGRVDLPSKLEVCSRCRGKGSHTNPSIDGNGITSAEMDELGPEFLEDYLGGVYDVPCERCGGRNVSPVLDRERCDPRLLEAHDDQEREAHDHWAEVEAERRAGA